MVRSVICIEVAATYLEGNQVAKDQFSSFIAPFVAMPFAPFVANLVTIPVGDVWGWRMSSTLHTKTHIQALHLTCVIRVQGLRPHVRHVILVGVVPSPFIKT